MTDERIATRARSFGSVAESYDRFRPGPPMAAVEWLLPSPCRSVLDLGAGTGALSRRLGQRATTVFALEPDRRMLAVLADRSPGVRSVKAVAEHLPIAATILDAAVASSAWHWMDTDKTVAEISRVLRPGGVLGIVGNGPDRSVEWVEELLGRRDPTREERDARAVRHRVDLSESPSFDELETCVINWTLPMTREELIGLAGTYSSTITLPPDQRADEMQRVRDAVASGPATDGRGSVEMPMRCRCWRSVRL
jgi:SAM-dependent methyltransferase